MKIEILLLLLLTALLWGVTPVLEKIGLGKVDALTAVTIRSLAVAVSLIVYVVFTGKVKQILQADAKTVIIFSATGLIAGLFGMLTYFAALKRGATSQVVPIAATYPLIAVLLSVLILGERITAMRVAGTVLIVLGIWFVQG